MTVVVHELVRSGLAELADSSYQARVRGGDGGSEMSSFVECVSTLFDDSGLHDAYERGHSVYGPSVDGALRELGSLVGKIDLERAPQEVLADPLMGRARTFAAEILRTLDEAGKALELRVYDRGTDGALLGLERLLARVVSAASEASSWTWRVSLGTWGVRLLDRRSAVRRNRRHRHYAGAVGGASER